MPSGRAKSPWRRIKPVVLALIVPLLLLAFWQVATTQRWTLLIPTPYAVAEYMVDFAVGGIYDDAYSATLLTHLLASMSRVYGGFALAALFALPIGIMVGRMPTGAHAARSFPAGHAADPGHGLAAFVDDPVRAGRQVGLRAGLPRRLLSDPAQHRVRRALGRSQAVRGGLDAGLPRQRAVLQGGAAGRDARHLHRPAAGSRPRLVRHRGRRDDRRAAGPGRRHHGRPHAVAHRAGDLRHDRDRRLRATSPTAWSC